MTPRVYLCDNESIQKICFFSFIWKKVLKYYLAFFQQGVGLSIEHIISLHRKIILINWCKQGTILFKILIIYQKEV